MGASAFTSARAAVASPPSARRRSASSESLAVLRASTLSRGRVIPRLVSAAFVASVVPSMSPVERKSGRRPIEAYAPGHAFLTRHRTKRKDTGWSVQDVGHGFDDVRRDRRATARDRNAALGREDVADAVAGVDARPEEHRDVLARAAQRRE